MTVIDVTKFGAVPNDGKSDTAAVLSALQECKKHGPAKIVFPKGRYHFFAGDNAESPNAVFPLAEANGVEIDGQGSEFIFSGFTGAFFFAKCNGVTIKNLTIDWDRPPFSMGVVEDVEDEHFDVLVLKDYPLKGGEGVGAFMDYDPQTRLPKRHGLDEYYTVKSTELLRPQVIRLHLNHKATIKKGSWVLLRHFVYGRNAIGVSECRDVKVENVTVHTVPGMGLVGTHCHNVTLDRFSVVPRPGSGYLMSATADAVHLGGNTGKITIRNCEFEGMGDDAINCKAGHYLAVKKIVDDHTVLAAHNLKLYDAPEPGHVMEFTDPVTLLPFATAQVKSAKTLPNDGLHEIEFTQPLPTELKDGVLLGDATSRVLRR